MITVTFNEHGFKAEGHALFARYGQDVVCAGVSAIITGAFNVFSEAEAETDLRQGYGNLYIYDLNSTAKTILKVIYTQLKTVENSYPDSITVKGDF